VIIDLYSFENFMKISKKPSKNENRGIEYTNSWLTGQHASNYSTEARTFL